MNLQQLEYVLAVEREGYFTAAAQKCFVTQATLSMMIRKLEEELGIRIFDRSAQPVTVTTEGSILLDHVRNILREVQVLKLTAHELRGEITGDVRIGIIPTLAPYLLPLFLKPLSERFPELNVSLREMTTERIVGGLQRGDLDIGLAATPLHENLIDEFPLFYEEFYAYAAASEKLPVKKYLLPRHINPNHLWLLEEGHCMRNQLFNLCELKVSDSVRQTLHYEAGSIETLINIVDRSGGITVIPQLATLRLHSSQKKKLREFAHPKPVREISVLTRKNYPRKKLLEYVKGEILKGVRRNVILDGKGLQIVSIEN